MVGQATRVAGGDDQDRHGFGKRLGHAAKGVLGAGAVLHAEHPDLGARGHPRVGVGHMQPGAFLAHDDRPDVLLGGRLDQRIDRVGEEDVNSLRFHGSGDGGGDVHRFGPLFMG